MCDYRYKYILSLFLTLVCFLPFAFGDRGKRGLLGSEELSPSEKAFRNMSADLQRILSYSDDPELYLQIKQKEVLMIQLYAAVDARRRYGRGKKVNRVIVESLMQLHELLGYDSMMFWPNLARPEKSDAGGDDLEIRGEGVAFVMLRTFTCQVESVNYEEIKRWWKKHKDESRAQWARESVDEVLSWEHFSDRGRRQIAGVTCNYRVLQWSEKEFREWWDEFKTETPDEWALDTLEWGSKHLGSEDEQERKLAWRAIHLAPPEARQINPRILEGTTAMRRELEKWIEANREEYRLSQVWPIGRL